MHVKLNVSYHNRSSLLRVFNGTPGKYVSLKETIRGFKGILNGEYDHIPEQAFYMVGTIDEALEKPKICNHFKSFEGEQKWRHLT